MKKTWITVVCAAALLMAVFFRDSILDLLPIDQSGWVERDGVRYLLDEDGDPRTGWYTAEDGIYYFREDGAMHTGWLEDEKGRCYLGADGHPRTGWLELEGRQHYFDSEGFLVCGLLELNSKRYFLDESGTPVSGWQQVGESYCYVLENGTIPSGWMEIEGKKYYLTDRGFRYTGWLDDSNGRYYFAADGVMAVGWKIIQNQTYYFQETGSCHAGWLELGSKRYYLGTDGVLYTGWLEEDGKRYYLQSDGTAAVGKLEIDGQNYFFSSTGMNFILVNPWNYLPEGFAPELVEAFGTQIDPACREDLEQMLADCRAAGFNPKIVSGYRSIPTQEQNLQNAINLYLQMGFSAGEAYSAAVKGVAVPGTSEHHLGLALDIVDAAYLPLDYHQENMPAQKWLMENSWKYGFILRYPKGSTEVTGIIYEPWHYRYVGRELAAELYELGNIPLETYIENLTAGGSQTKE